MSRPHLSEDGLVLAPISIVSSEALAKTLTVVADSASTAVTSLGVSVSEKDIGSTGALLEGAVGSTESKIANATHVLVIVPGSVVGGSGIGGKLGLGGAKSTSIAVSGADGALAGHALVVIEALALSSFPVADSLVGALHLGVSLIGSGGGGDPGSSLGAGALGAIVLSPGGGAVGAGVASTLVCLEKEREEREEKVGCRLKGQARVLCVGE